MSSLKLIRAIRSRNSSKMLELLEQNPSPRARDLPTYTPLHCASQTGVKYVQILSEKLEDALFKRYLRQGTETGDTPVHLACSKRPCSDRFVHSAILKFLCESYPEEMKLIIYESYNEECFTPLQLVLIEGNRKAFKTISTLFNLTKKEIKMCLSKEEMFTEECYAIFEEAIKRECSC